ncbi:alpha/beta hydrolase [Amycolatopsis sp. NPDC059027]|uniref:alpha/beta hydrolase n=1 Tax=unclassified Amycolatopsis TaxID=2618356 RepID=UPI00366D7426
MRSSVSRGLGLLAAAVATTAIVVPGTAAAAESPAVKWGPCPADVAAPQLQCGTLDVPLDYRKPDGKKLQVAVSRLASTKPAQRRGVLLMNPGGPGGPGLNMPLQLLQLGLPASVADSYDLIGFDPRGVGHSTPVTCDLKTLQSNVPPYARDAADVAKRATAVEGVAKKCATSKTASILPYITTANTARDMDAIRAALGEKKISYYGISYGTYLGSVFSTLFPQRTDRIVLDSVVGPGGLDVTGSRRFGQGFQDRFPDFAKWAAARNDSYGLGKTPQQVTANYFALAERLDKTPVGAIDGSAFRAGVLGALYDTTSFPKLAQQWQALTRGVTPAVEAAALPPEAIENLLASQLHVACNDNAWPRSVATYQHNVAVDRERYPMFGAAAANIWACAFWPSQPLEPPVKIGDRGPSNILVVQNLRDPATPLVGARETRRALGDRARMVTVDQGGHGVYVFAPNACGNNAVNRFLVDGQRPAHDTACGADTGNAFSGLSPEQQRQREQALDERRALPVS